MPYLVTQDLLDELGEDTLVKLTDDEATGTVSNTRVLKAIDFASGVFDSYARSRYSIPVLTTPMVRSLNLDLAVYHLYKSRSQFAEGIYAIKKTAYEDAVKLLKDISAGRAALDVPSATETETLPANEDRILTNAAKTTFTDDRLKSF